MRSNYRKIGDFIKQSKLKNEDGRIDLLLGVNLDKKLMPSVANLNGVDLTKYKVIKKGQFGCKLMSVGRDKKVPISRLTSYDDAIISSAYFVFEVVDENELNPEYLMMWFSRSESDRFQWFQSGADIRGRITWEEFCSLPIKVPTIEKQREIVKEYNTIVNRIKLNEQLNQKLEETAQALYKHWFVDFEFPNENGQPYKSSGGEMVFNEGLDMEIPEGWGSYYLDELGEVIDSLHKTPKYASSGYAMVRVTDVNGSFLDLTNTLKVDLSIFKDFSSKYLPKKGDVIMTRVGTYGVCSYVGSNEEFCLGQNTVVITSDKIAGPLLFTALTNDYCKYQIEEGVTGSTQKTISLKLIRGLNLMFPTNENLRNELSIPFVSLFSFGEKVAQETIALDKSASLILSRLTIVENTKPVYI
ncbi:restriction endonuclease subunit S [Saprospiraceae bacterium]|nr:restriction endonuclease subunit S [Saprospiraceae bacterium]